MSNGRNFVKRRVDTDRVAGGFCAIPWEVLDSEAYRQLSHTARSLLMEVARQHVRDNNGQLLLSKNHLIKRGWTSSDTITRAKRELLDSKLIYETVKGHRPNRASWYALTWYSLYNNPKFDHGAFEGFKKGAYRDLPLKTQTLDRRTVLTEARLNRVPASAQSSLLREAAL